jgi:hypothetical protein
MNTQEFCEKYLKKYTINSNNTVDIDGHVDLDLYELNKIPIKFGKVSDYFNCCGNNLTTLENSPNYVGYIYLCSMNKLTSLEGGPSYVGGNFICDKNKLTTLEYCPKYVGGDFECDVLTHHILGNVQGDIYCKRRRTVI